MLFNKCELKKNVMFSVKINPMDPEICFKVFKKLKKIISKIIIVMEKKKKKKILNVFFFYENKDNSEFMHN